MLRKVCITELQLKTLSCLPISAPTAVPEEKAETPKQEPALCLFEISLSIRIIFCLAAMAFEKDSLPGLG